MGRAEKNEAALLNCAELPELALTAILRGCNNSFGYRKASGLFQLGHEHGQSCRITMSAARGSAILQTGEVRGLDERHLHVSNLCIAAIKVEGGTFKSSGLGLNRSAV